MTLVGLISDTHGLLRPQAIEALSGTSYILHAGDVGTPEILDGLRKIAPVTAVRGNVDCGAWADRLPSDATVSIQGHRIHVLHILPDLQIDPAVAKVSVVLYGHTHKPLIEAKGGVLYVNPGSAGPRRFTLPMSVGFLRFAPHAPPEAWLETLEP
jgi:putative phosphoesterase